MKMNTKLKYLPIAAFAAIALTLAGCGGGGGGGAVTSSTGAPSAEMVEAAAAAVMAAETAKTALSDAWAAYEMAPSEAGATAITDAAAALVAAAAVLGEAAVDDDQTAAVEGFNAYAALVGAVLDNAGRAVASVEMAAMLAAAEAARLAQMEAEAAKVAALEAAAMEAEAAKVAALEAAAMEAEAAKVAALEAAAMEAEAAKQEALMEAATAADAALQAALIEAAGMAEADRAEALRLANEAHATALSDAATAAEEAQRVALSDAATAAEEAQRVALSDAATAAEEAQRVALSDAATAAEEAQRVALADAATAAEEAQRVALSDAATAAEEAQRVALEEAATAAKKLLDAASMEVTRLYKVLDNADVDNPGLNQQLETAQAEVTRLEGVIDSDDVDNPGLNQQLATAKGKVDALTVERDTAQDALFAAGVDKAILEATAAMQTYARLLVTYEGIDADADTARGLVTAANRAKTEADEALEEAQAGDDIVLTVRAERAVRQADAAVSTANAQLAEARTTAAAMPYAMAIMTPATTPAVLAASATRKGDAVTVTVTVGDPGTVIAKGPASDAGHGWYKADVANEDDSKETGTVYTNIENTMMKFDAVHLATTDAIESVADTGVLNLEEMGDPALAALNRLVSASSFPGASDGDLTLTYKTGAEKKFDGTFDGVPGEYSCTTMENCTATANSKGELTGLGGMWTFIPAYLGEDGESLMTGTDEAQATSREDDLPVPNVAVPDTDYLHFGWWTKVDKDGDVAFRTFSGGSGGLNVIADDVALADLAGTATYKGPAAGRYAVKTFNSNSTLDSIRHGEFTAAAVLTASFGGGAIAADDHNSMSGTVTNFASQSDDLSAWSVDLKKTKFTDLTAMFAAGEVGGGVGGSPVNYGKWNGQFFGNPAADTGPPDPSDDYPNSVAGEFDAHSSHGHVAGAFGATR